MRRGFLRQGGVHMAAGFLAMGGWAFFANRGHPMPAPLIATLVQGSISAVITLFLKRMIEAISARLSGALAVIVPPLAAALLSVALLTTLHGLAGTPEIVTTIAVPLAVSTGYALIYSIALRKS